jgi:RHS repeat-associated protein
VKPEASVYAGIRRALVFTYDYAGRRIQKDVFAWNPSTLAYEFSSQARFVYDGWNLLAVLDTNNAPQLSFTWGTDLSGTIQGAGGVGGLLAVTVHSGENAGTYLCTYDGNGNVAALLNANDSSVAAIYEYGPFGEPLRATGPMARVNPFRFSTKYQDDETDLLYYGYRYYTASTGRWLSRDPAEEGIGGENLYGFCANNPQLFTDRDGRDFGLWIGAGSGYTRWNPPSSPPPANSGIDQSVIDAANQEYGYAFEYYTDGANALTYSQVYGPDSPWTQAFRHEYQSHFDVARTDIRRMILNYCCKGKRDGILNSPQAADYSINNLTPAENLGILIGDFARYLGLSSELKRTGSFRATYGVESIDCSSKCAKVKFVANDSFRFGSMTRIPLTNISLPDNPNGSYRAPWNTVYLTWHWEETICFRK